MVYNFNEQKYKDIFAQMYGANAFENGMAQARKIGTSAAQAELAKDEYAERLREARAAAKAQADYEEALAKAQEALGGSAGSDPYDELIKEWKGQKYKSNQSNLGKYYETESKNLNKGRSKARKKIEDIYPGAIPSVRDNKKLTAWDKMKLMGG